LATLDISREPCVVRSISFQKEYAMYLQSFLLASALAGGAVVGMCHDAKAGHCHRGGKYVTPIYQTGHSSCYRFVDPGFGPYGGHGVYGGYGPYGGYGASGGYGQYGGFGQSPTPGFGSPWQQGPYPAGGFGQPVYPGGGFGQPMFPAGGFGQPVYPGGGYGQPLYYRR
jgi:hypothetical protein